jgi:hypothetical protein
MPHNIYPSVEVKKIKIEHLHPESIRDKIALTAIKLVRGSYDFFTRYDPNKMT